MNEMDLLWNKILCIKLVNYRDKYTEMHGQQSVKTLQGYAKDQQENSNEAIE